MAIAIASQWSPITGELTVRPRGGNNRVVISLQSATVSAWQRIVITFWGRTRKKFPDSACNTTCGVRLGWIAGNGLALPLANAFSMSEQVQGTPLSIYRTSLGQPAT